MKKPLLFFLVVCTGCGLFAGPARNAGLRYDFSDPGSLKKYWEFHGGLFMVPRTEFKICNEPSASDGKVLVVEAKSSTGVLMTDPKVDLKKNPIMRWRWRIIRTINTQAGQDVDDQAAVVYLGDGTMIRQKCVGYRWEHFTASGTRQKLKYAGGMMQVDAVCIRNRKTEPGNWVVEERNVLEDFRKAYKRYPGKYFVLGIGANSQHTNSHTRVEIDYLEFLPASGTEKK